MDDRTKGLAVLLGVGIVAYTIGYRNGVRSMVREWTATISPSVANYLAAHDTVTQILKEDDDSSPD